MAEPQQISSLDPTFATLPIPIPPPATAAAAFRRRLRRQLLALIGRGFSSQNRFPPSAFRLPPSASILLIRPDHLGDLLFLTPALRHLRQSLPEARLTLLIGPWGRPVLENNPHLDEILTCDFPYFNRKPAPSPWQPYRYLFEQARRLRARTFDAAVILRFDHWWGAWLAAAARIPLRLGYAIPEVKPFLTHSLPYEDRRHEVEQNWGLVNWLIGELVNRPAGQPVDPLQPLQFFPTADDRAWAQDFHSEFKTQNSKLILIHPGSGAPVKGWRVEAWARLAERLVSEHDARIVLTGGPDEVELCRAVAEQANVAITGLAGQTSFGQLAALQRRAVLVIGPDCGPLKLAAAVGAPTLQLYGPVDPVKFGPWGGEGRHKIVTAGLSCSPCHRLDYPPEELAAHFCVRGLSLAAVLAAAGEVLGALGEGSRFAPTAAAG
ncbi:MAG: glycosyltransferase family 9 protein [Anaerolineae bacterium]